MIVHSDIQNLPAFKNAIVTVGVFDGVHLGHQHIIKLMKWEAAQLQGETVVVTFHPHPRQILPHQANEIPLLTTLDEKIALLEQFGVDHLVVIPFTSAFSQQTAEQYIDDFLVNTFHPHTLIVGHDHRFGKNRSGNFKLLEKKASALNFIVKEVPPLILDEKTISSTLIRETLLKSEVETANQFLGYEYFFSGTVEIGNKLGKTLGYPTANILLNEKEKLVPGYGVYAVDVLYNQSLFKGMMNIGVRPTVAGITRIVEVHILDFDTEIYGKELTIKVKMKLRNEIKFKTLNDLKEQLAKDKMAILELFP